MVFAGLTELMGSGEGRRQAVVFDHRAAPLGVAHGAHIRHAKSVTGGSSTQVLGEKKEDIRTSEMIRTLEKSSRTCHFINASILQLESHFCGLGLHHLLW